jgi:RimJ/RimL family protein N-acetyltransferase
MKGEERAHPKTPPEMRSRKINSIMPSPSEAHSAGKQTSTRRAQSIEIRRLTEKDATEFSRLRLEALEREPRAFGESPEHHRAMTHDEIAKRLGSGSDDRNFVLGAVAEGCLVGMAGFYQEQGPKSQHKGHIWGVYVNQDWRGKGIARRLLADLIQLARSTPEIEQLMLGVAAGQNPAKRVYQSLGFELYGHEPRAIKLAEGYVDEDLMVLRLR